MDLIRPVAPINPGDRVEAEGIGTGVVDRITPTGAVVQLLDPPFGGLKINLPLHRLTVVSSVMLGTTLPDLPATPTAPAPMCGSNEDGAGHGLPGSDGSTGQLIENRRATTTVAVEPLPQLDPATVSRQRAVEALRFGLVPDEGLEELTLGYDDLRRWVTSRLAHRNGGHPQVSEVTGPFGTGKSHTMSVIRHVARQEGYLTAKVEVDGNFVSLSEPARLLHALWSTLRGPNLDSPTPLLDLYLRAIDLGHPAPSIAPRGIDRVNDNYSTIEYVLESDVIEEWAEDLEAVLSSSPEVKATEVRMNIARAPSIDDPFTIKARPMIGIRVAERPYDFLEALVGHTAVAALAGFKGIVLTIDEFEVEHNLTGDKLSRVTQLIGVLTSYLAGRLDHPNVPISIFFATVGQYGHTGDAIVDVMLDAAGGDHHVLRVWDGRQRGALARRIHGLYCDAYGIEAEYDSADTAAVVSLVADAIGEESEIRAFIKHYIAHLDYVHGPRAA